MYQLLNAQQANPVLTGYQMAEDAHHSALQNQLLQLQKQFMPQQLDAQTQLMEAQARRQNALANLPFGGASLPGVAGQIMGLEAVKNMYGESSPQYASAKKLFDLNQQSMLSRIGYQNALTGSMSDRYLTPTGKSMVEQARVGQGLAPTGQNWNQSLGGSQTLNLSPEQVQRLSSLIQPQVQNAQGQQTSQNQNIAPGAPGALADQYELLRQKSTTDASARNRNLFATNIEKTLSQINPDDLVQYAGYTGAASRKGQELLAGFGKGYESQNYDKYLKAKKATELLAKQVRQFYGDSIQPSMIQSLETLADPSVWNTNPRLAKEIFAQTKNILGMELKTYRDALTSRGAYQSQSNEQQPQSNAGQSDPLGIR